MCIRYLFQKWKLLCKPIITECRIIFCHSLANFTPHFAGKTSAEQCWHWSKLWKFWSLMRRGPKARTSWTELVRFIVKDVLIRSKSAKRLPQELRHKIICSGRGGQHFLRRTTLKTSLLPGTAYSCNRFEDFNKTFYTSNSHFRFSKYAVSNETCGIKSREF